MSRFWKKSTGRFARKSGKTWNQEKVGQDEYILTKFSVICRIG
jgi:hypothetical protein